MVFDWQIPNLKEACRMIDVCLYLPGVAAVAPLRSVAAVNPHILLDLSKNKRGHQSQTWSGSRVH